MKTSFVKICIFLLVMLTVVACNNPRNFEGGITAEMAVHKSDGNAYNIAAPVAHKVSINIERKLIRTGRLNFETHDVSKTKIEIDKACKEFGAYIASDHQSNHNNQLEFMQEIRVPAARFDGLLSQIESLGSRTQSKNINTQDVTEEYIDVEARLNTKKELEQRYLQILKQAKSLADVIALESQIANVRSEIESMQGKLNYLHSQVSYSTLTITYYEHIGTDFGFASKFVQSLRNGWDYLLTSLIGLISIWPFVILFVAIVWFVIRRRRRAVVVVKEVQ
jgi:hypothetical protein